MFKYISLMNIVHIMEKNQILKVKEFFEKNKGKCYRFLDLTKALQISDIMLLEIMGILQREYNLPLTWV